MNNTNTSNQPSSTSIVPINMNYHPPIPMHPLGCVGIEWGCSSSNTKTYQQSFTSSYQLVSIVPVGLCQPVSTNGITDSNFRPSGRCEWPCATNCVGLIIPRTNLSLISFLNHSVFTCETIVELCLYLTPIFSKCQTLRADRRAVNLLIYINNTPNRFVSSSWFYRDQLCFLVKISHWGSYHVLWAQKWRNDPWP